MRYIAPARYLPLVLPTTFLLHIAHAFNTDVMTSYREGGSHVECKTVDWKSGVINQNNQEHED